MDPPRSWMSPSGWGWAQQTPWRSRWSTWCPPSGSATPHTSPASREPTSLPLAQQALGPPSPRPAGPGPAFSPPCRSWARLPPRPAGPRPAFYPPSRSWARLLPAQQVLGPPSPRPAGSGPAFLPPCRSGTRLPAGPAGPGPAVQEANAPPPRPSGPATGCVAWESLFTSLSRSIRVDGAASCLARRKGLPRDRVVFVELFLPREEALCLQPLGRAVFPFVKEPQDPISGSPPGSSWSRDRWGLAESPRAPQVSVRCWLGLIHSANPYAAPTVCSAARPGRSNEQSRRGPPPILQFPLGGAGRVGRGPRVGR